VYVPVTRNKRVWSERLERYIVITTKFGNYKCHAYNIKSNKVYFNSRAVRLPTVISIVLKDGTVAYENTEIKPLPKARTVPHHCSTLKGAVKCKATKKGKAQPRK